METSQPMSLDEFKKAVGEYWHDSLEKVEGKYRSIVAEAVNKVAGKAGDAAWWLACRSAESLARFKILEVFGNKKWGIKDFLLIDYIRDQKDAQLVGPLIDKESYPLYLEKVQRFY